MQIDFPQRAFAGYIFDLDGTLIDSMPVHYQAWDAAMREAGVESLARCRLACLPGGDAADALAAALCHAHTRQSMINMAGAKSVRRRRMR